MIMPTRFAHARWEGSLKEGKGNVDFGNGLFSAPYSFASRFDESSGTNPEELLGAAHAGCFAMALSLILGDAGYVPDYIDATASITISPRDGTFSITKSHLKCEARVPGLDETEFARFADRAKVNCPVSRALAGTSIALDAELK
jgi:osmotically inducible protein OsmC